MAGAPGPEDLGDDRRLLFHNTMRITDGHVAPFRAAIEEAVAFARDHAPQLMVDVFIDEPAMRAHSFQLYDSSDAVRRHWELSDPYIRGVMAHCRVERFVVYGRPDDALAQALAGSGMDLHVVPRLTGFLRPP